MKVKSRRKIWSIPIAALALVLMLAGGYGGLCMASCRLRVRPRVPGTVSVVATD